MWSIRLKYTEIEKTPLELFTGRNDFSLLLSTYSLDLGKWEIGDKNQYTCIYKYTWSIWKEKIIKDIIRR